MAAVNSISLTICDICHANVCTDKIGLHRQTHLSNQPIVQSNVPTGPAPIFPYQQQMHNVPPPVSYAPYLYPYQGQGQGQLYTLADKIRAWCISAHLIVETHKLASCRQRNFVFSGSATAQILSPVVLLFDIIGALTSIH